MSQQGVKVPYLDSIMSASPFVAVTIYLYNQVLSQWLYKVGKVRILRLDEPRYYRIPSSFLGMAFVFKCMLPDRSIASPAFVSFP